MFRKTRCLYRKAAYLFRKTLRLQWASLIVILGRGSNLKKELSPIEKLRYAFNRYREEPGIDTNELYYFSILRSLDLPTEKMREKPLLFVELADELAREMEERPELLEDTSYKHFLYGISQNMESSGEDKVARAGRKLYACIQKMKKKLEEESNISDSHTSEKKGHAPRALKKEVIFEVLIEEILADGKVTAEEQAILKSVCKFLNIDPREYGQMVLQVRNRIKLLGPKAAGDAEPRTIYRRCYETALENGVIEQEEKQLLGKIAEALMLLPWEVAEIETLVKESLSPDKKPGGPV
jgi:hypothetical protein